MSSDVVPAVEEAAEEAVEEAIETPVNNSDSDAGKTKFPIPFEEMSKNKRKKLERQKKWIDGKAERKRREREKEKERRLKKRLAITENRALLVEPKPKIKMSDSPCKISIVIDCSYGEFMGEDLIRKFCKQINRCYSANRKSDAPVQMYLTSVSLNIKDALDAFQPGHVNWDCNVDERHWNNVFVTEKQLDKNNIIYLTGDSPNNPPELKEIQSSDNLVFIIGGLLDHNQHKGASLKRAKSFGIRHAKLPIGDHIKMCQRKILSIPHVFEIMMLAANGKSGDDWSKIFQLIIPARKIEKSVEPVKKMDTEPAAETETMEEETPMSEENTIPS